MPIDLPSLSSKVDYDVKIALRTLADAVNRLEARVGGGASLRADAAISHAQERQLERIENLEKRVQALEQAP